jgi:alpha-glucoside transport system substrate-binding protein
VPDAATFLFTDPPNCWLHMQGGFVTGFFSEEVQAELDNRLGTFVMPPIDANVTPALEVGGDTFMVFKGHDRPEVRKFIEFLATADSTTPWAQAGGAVFPHQGQDFAQYKTGIEGTLAQIVSEAEVARFDGSDQMDAAVNAAFWKAVTDWASGSRDLDGALQDIDAVRPQ